MRRIVEASALLSTVLFATAAVASTPATDAAVSTQTRPARSMITSAKILHAPQADFTRELGNGVRPNAAVVLKLNVSEDGKARDIEVVKSDDPVLNGPVVEAVSKYQFRPARLDNQPVSIGMNLIVKVHD